MSLAMTTTEEAERRRLRMIRFSTPPSLMSDTATSSPLRDRPTREELDEELDMMLHESSLFLGAPECQCSPCQNAPYEQQQHFQCLQKTLTTLNVQ